MFVASHSRNKAFRTSFISIILILITSACNTGSSNQGADPIFVEKNQKPYNQATEELAIQTYVEKIDQQWNSLLTELTETGDMIDGLVERVSLLSTSDYLKDIDNEELVVLEEQLESELIKIEQIKNKFKMIAPLRSPQDYLDYTDAVTNGFVEEMENLINLFEQMTMTAQDVDIEEVEEEMYLGLSDINKRPYLYEHILFEDDVQDYMEPYVKYAEEIVVYIGLRTLLINQEANLVASLIHIAEQVGETDIVNDQDWTIFNTEMLNLLTIQDRLESEPVPIFTRGDQSNTNLHRGRVTALSDLSISDSTSQTTTIIILCGNSKHNAVISEAFICPDITEEEKQFLKEMDKKWQDYLEDWQERKVQGLNDIVEENFEKFKEKLDEMFDCIEENCGDEYSSNCYCDMDMDALHQNRDRKMDSFIEKMEREKQDHRAELDQEIEDWKKDQKDEITKEIGLRLTANHQMFVASRPAYTIEVSGSETLRYNPWSGVLGLYYFPMLVNWPVGQGVQVIGGDMVSMVIDGMCEDGIMYLTFYGEHFGSTGYGEVVNPVKYAPVTTFVYRNKSPYYLQFNIAGSGGTASIPASDRNSELGGTLTWTLEANQ